jgi:molybdate transport system substrate-binding protein
LNRLDAGILATKSLGSHSMLTRDLMISRLTAATRITVLAVLAGMALAPLPGHAEPLKVFSAGACERFVSRMAAQFEKQHGTRVLVEEGTVGQLVQRINQGARFDVTLLTPAGLERVAGRVRAGSRVELVRVGIGVAVRDNTPRPDITTVESFKRTLRLARSVAYVDPAAGGTSGIYFSRLLERLGVADAVKPKAVLVPGGAVAQRVATGEAEIGIQMASELVGVKGVTLVGPLPAPIQTYTVYAGAISVSTHDPNAAQALIDLLASPEANGLLKAAGLERPAHR